MVKINEILRKYRKLYGISLDELTRKTGVPKSTLSRYENNPNQKIDIKTFSDIAKVLKIPTEVIESIWIDEHSLPRDIMVKIPVLGKVCAGNGIIADENIIGYETAESKYSTDDYFFLSVSGNSMSPQIDSGDIVLVKRQDSVESGEVAVVIVDNEDGMLKKVIYDKEHVRLVSFNPYYPEMMFRKADMDRVNIIGKVIESKRKW